MNAHRLPENSVLDEIIKLHKIKDKKMSNFECFTLALIVVEHKPFISEEWLSIQKFQNNVVYTIHNAFLCYDIWFNGGFQKYEISDLFFDEGLCSKQNLQYWKHTQAKVPISIR